MRLDLLAALERRYESDVLAAQANIRTYVESPVGIGEHPDLVEAVHEQMQKVAEAHELLTCVRGVREMLTPKEESGAPSADV